MYFKEFFTVPGTAIIFINGSGLSIIVDMLFQCANFNHTLHQDQDYHCVHRYAAKALAIVPNSADIYYWLIHAIHKQGHTENARSELRTAKNQLLEEDYAMLANRLAVEANMI